MATARMHARDRKLRKMLTNKERQTRREELKRTIVSSDSDPADVMKAVLALSKRPRDESRSRHTRACVCCGRKHSVLRRFGLCRLCLRKMACKGIIPGLTMASWS